MKTKMKTKMKTYTIALLFASAILTMCACGKNEDNIETAKNGTEEKITMVLDWTPNTNHTGLYVAEELGYFQENNLEVSIIQPPDNGATDLVASGGAEFGIDFQDTLAAAFAGDTPLPVTAVAAVMQHNTSGLISRKEKGITTPSKLQGHTYATWDSPIEQAMLKNVVEQDGGDFSRVNQISTSVEDIVAALHTDIDSVWIYYGWDGIKCEMEGLAANYLPFAQMNPVFDYYSPVIIGNNTYLKEHPDVAKRFLAAVKKGYEYAVEHPSEAAGILSGAVPELEAELVNKSQEYVSKEYIADASSWGTIDADRWNAFYRWLSENKLVENPLEDNTGFSNEYLN